MNVVILASHPVQYHAPVFCRVAEQLTQAGHHCLVVYLSDFSIQGYQDAGFGTAVAWDEPLLAGYRSQILNLNQTQQPQGFADLKAPGWKQVLRREQPTRLLVTNLNYQGALVATLQARLRGIPATLRVETNDRAVARSPWKGMARSMWYRSVYPLLFDSAIAIGSLNREHLVRHGINARNVGLAYYCVPDRFQCFEGKTKRQLRQSLRAELGFEDERTVFLFSGKLIAKKNPQLILDAVAQLPAQQRDRIALLYLGSGELAERLQTAAAHLTGVKVHFAGFKNQQQLPPYYLAADALILPSKQAGETWGLVVNEALQAGLPCIVTQSVGCAVDFQSFPHFQIIPEPDTAALARAIATAIPLVRDFDRYTSLMQSFSIETCAQSITDFLLIQD